MLTAGCGRRDAPSVDQPAVWSRESGCSTNSLHADPGTSIGTSPFPWGHSRNSEPLPGWAAGPLAHSTHGVPTGAGIARGLNLCQFGLWKRVSDDGPTRHWPHVNQTFTSPAPGPCVRVCTVASVPRCGSAVWVCRCGAFPAPSAFSTSYHLLDAP